MRLLRSRLFAVAAGLLVLSVTIPLCTSARRGASKSPQRAAEPAGKLLPEERATIELFKNAKDSVVYITTLVVRRDIFSLNVSKIPRGTGSGFIWDKKGHVVTNYHVLMGADVAQVTLADGTSAKAELVGVAPNKDLAVLRITQPGTAFKPLRVGTSHDLQVGQKVFAIGNPFGLDQTLTTGVISALGREIQSLTGRPIQGVVQTDAAINPGNSGGPLLDSSGRLIGVNTQIYSPSGAFAGVGFAVPVDIVNGVVPQLIAYGRVIRPGLGIFMVDDYLARRLGVSGVLIKGVERGSAAERAGLRASRLDYWGNLVLGDVIVGVDGEKIESANDLFKLLESRKVGESVDVTILRGGKKKKLPITLQALKN